MKTFIQENTWLHGSNHGWGNGYVLIPKGHPMHGKHYDDIDVDVHGGLTFSEKAEDCKGWLSIEPEDMDCWVVGFDTAHLNDSMDNWDEDMVFNETKRLARQLDAMGL